MNYTLAKIKRLILQGNVRFTGKARLEMLEDYLEETDVFEAIMNSTDIDKTLNSKNPFTGVKEKLYVIKGITYDNLVVYTKGKFQMRIFIS